MPCVREDPENQFFPSPGKIAQLREPSGPGVRLDSGVYPGWTVPLEYDPLLAKLVTWGPDRNTAIQRLQRASVSTLSPASRPISRSFAKS